MARVLALVPDLMLSSRVSGMLGAAGHEVTVAPTPPVAADFDFDLIVCDLEACDPAAVAKLPAPAIGFYSHVDVETRDRGREAGLDLVVPRSRMARELPGLAARLLD
ncbi:MAG TPA: hypothetical protein PKA56_08950 [Solirubrobacterales bacterium]|jgi:hypothetical protein|nr:hypothetical protein [Solirubrobacterales bacterium]HMU26149.1 hypothetical protein [Solirubrobacterales bacterium]HMW45664.1 hypothetical protein [Solirubrobacterales bacterium]HMX71870.1 hypothetical protein [Solirubrobacterales bacterium]HNA25000.1 hypothetical protein [Solirubrobacterales bacterium]